MSGVVKKGDHVCRMYDDEVRALRDREDVDGFFLTDEQQIVSRFRRGQLARVTGSGPFVGHVVKYARMGDDARHRAFAELMGREVEVGFFDDELEEMAAEAA